MKVQYATVAPTTPRGKWLVCSRRWGTGDRFAPIAECRLEAHADKIVAALEGIRAVVLQAAEQLPDAATNTHPHPQQ